MSVYLVLVLGVGGDGVPAMAARTTSSSKNLRLVNLFTGTDARSPDFGTGGGAGATFPGVSAPFGMLQWSPDTVPGRTNSAGGYSYGDQQIRGFSLTHLSGVGCPIFQDVPFLPTTVPVTTSPSVANSYAVEPRYVPSFSHRREIAEPGYYRVWLKPQTAQRIKVELTAKTRSGLGRFTYPATKSASMLVNAGGSAMANGDSVVHIDPDRREVSGWVESGQFCYHRNRYKMFFVAEFNRRFVGYGTWTRQDVVPGSIAATDHADNPFHLRPITGFPDPPSVSSGAQAGAYVTFDTTRGHVVLVRVGMSFVSVDNARENLRAEMPRWDFGAVRKVARDEWKQVLNRVRVRGGSRADRKTFYTMLYHALLGPNVFSDVNGEYMGMDGRVHTARDGMQYTNFSGWDIYRSEIPLLAILDPERTSQMMQSLLRNARESGWLPKWSVAGSHTNVMVGDPAAPIIAGAYAFGARAFDHGDALQAMLKGATEHGTSSNAQYVERAALPAYLELGYVPHEGTESSSGATTSMFGDSGAVWGSAATTLEYAVADFAIAQYAAALGDHSTGEAFLRRAANWRNVFNPASGYVQPRFGTGEFLSPFDPTSLQGYVEGNAAQYTWMVPHDVDGLITELGGPAAVSERLDRFFSELDAGPEAPFAFLGNEPTAQTPWIYNWLGQPHKTQEVVRRAMLALFDTSPTGYPGNDDVGHMSSWYIFAALGLYPAIPGTDVLAIGSPLFREVTLRRTGGTIRIVGRKAARDRPYVRRLTVNGRPHGRPWLRFRDLSGGGRLVFELAAEPGGDWGTNFRDAPPSFQPGAGTGAGPAE